MNTGLLESLQRFDTPTVCNVIELFGVRPQTTGYMDKRLRALYPELPPMVGYASTAFFRAAAPPAEKGAYATLDEQVKRFADLPGPAVIVFQDLDDPPVAATFGEVMTTVYKSFGAAGLVTSGAGRDLEQVRALKFPCFSDGLIASHGYPQIFGLHEPVHVGGLTILPGDLLHGDANGVTTIPHEIATEVADACEEFCQCEQAVLSYCRSGGVTAEGLAAARKEMGERMTRVRKTVK